MALMSGLLKAALKKLDLDPVCEWKEFPDGPESPPMTCGKQAVAQLTDPRCGHDTFVCEECVKLASRTQWWWCRECKKVTRTDRPVPFKIYVPGWSDS